MIIGLKLKESILFDIFDLERIPSILTKEWIPSINVLRWWFNFMRWWVLQGGGDGEEE